MNFELNTSNFLFLLFIIVFSIQLFYFLYFYIRLTTRQEKEKKQVIYKPVSIIIAARNERENLLNFLPKIFEQNYPEFEIIVVNDRSWDDSIDIIQQFAQKHENLHLVEIPDRQQDEFAKKIAVTLGIKAAKYDRLLFIDADCFPSGKNWIKEMSAQFASSTSLVLGASPYVREKGLLNKIIRFDASQIAVQYLSFAKAGIPYMGVGRNLAYTQELYDSVRGFKSHYHIPSGDDDLFVNQVANKKNTAIVFSEDSLIYTLPKKTFGEWFQQKKRHLSTSKHYKTGHKALLFLYPLSLITMYVSLVFLLVMHNWWYIALGFVLFRLLIQMSIFSRPFRVMGSKDLIIIAPILELILLFISPTLLLGNKNKKQKHGFKRR